MAKRENTSSARKQVPPEMADAPAPKVDKAGVEDETIDRAPEGGIQSIERAFSILEEVARNPDGIGLADLSKRVGLHTSTAHHLAKTMVALGYIRRIPNSKRYRIGRPLFALAARALDETEMINLATPVLEDLARETGEGSHFAVRMNDAVIVIARNPGPGAFQVTDYIGVVRPAYCTALGKIILAALRPDQFERYLEDTELKPRTAKTISDPARLRAEISEVRTSGLAFDDGEFDDEMRCAAMPVRAFNGQILGAIGISGPIWRLSIQALQARIHLLKHAADQLSEAFGAKATDK